jgi:hypothetical protein
LYPSSLTGRPFKFPGHLVGSSGINNVIAMSNINIHSAIFNTYTDKDKDGEKDIDKDMDKDTDMDKDMDKDTDRDKDSDTDADMDTDLEVELEL